MKDISTSEILTRAWGFLKTNPLVLIGICVLSWALGYLLRYLAYTVQNTTDKSTLSLYGITSIVLILLFLILHMGILRIVTDIIEGKQIKFDKLLSGIPLLWRFVLIGVIFALVILFIALIGLAAELLVIYYNLAIPPVYVFMTALIPITYFLLRYGFAPLVLIDQQITVWGSFKESARITQDNRLSILGLGLVLLVLNSFGAMLYDVGLLITLPLTLLSYVLVYKKLA
jgi:uncharacterized membrane protein